MKLRLILAGLGMLGVVGFGLLWATGRLAGQPTLPASDANGTSRVFDLDKSQALSVISNTFRLFRYHDMMLSDAVGSDYLASNWHPIGGFVLRPTVSVVGTVPTKGVLGNRQLGYVATFHITCTSVTASRTKINVQTVTAKLLDGVSLGHGGIVANTRIVLPVRQEEENVLKAIEAEMASEVVKVDSTTPAR